MKPTRFRSARKPQFRCARESLSDDGGFALATVLLGLLAAFSLATVMTISSISSSSGVARDQSSKSAVGVAEAGVSEALLRYNRFTTSTSMPCVAEGDSGQAILTAAQANGWCPPVTANGAGGSYSYSVKPAATGFTVVSTGTYNGINRRVQVGTTYSAVPGSPGQAPFASAQVIAKDWIKENSGGRITADVATSGYIGLDNGSKLTCTLAIVGVTLPSVPFNPDRGNRSCDAVGGWMDLPAVNSTPYATSNSNAAIGTGCWLSTGTPPRITLNSSCQMTLGVSGQTSDFYLCKLILNSGTALFIRTGATVNIWYAPPSACGGDTQPFVSNSGSRIEPVGSTPPIANLAMLVSDSTTTTTMNLNSGGQWFDCAHNFVIYAPTTNITLNTGPHICGGVAGKSLTVNSGSSLTKSTASGTWVVPGSSGAPLPHYTSSSFLECTPTNSSTTPNAGC